MEESESQVGSEGVIEKAGGGEAEDKSEKVRESRK